MLKKSNISGGIKILLAFFLMQAGLWTCLYSHDTNESAGPDINFEEKPGQMVPSGLTFTDEYGKKVTLQDVIQGPTVLSILYYRCPNACNTIIVSIASVLKNSNFKSGSEPNIITLSIDPSETTNDAMKSKKIAYAMIQNGYPDNKWHFLTGSADSIKKLTDTVGFHYTRSGSEFDHPIGLIILSPQGKVVRYILGSDYLPVDLTMSLLEASSGVVKPTIARVLRFCFSYDPKNSRLVFNTLRISAIFIILIAAVFITYLIISGRKRRA